MATLKSNGEELLRICFVDSNLFDMRYEYKTILSYRSNDWILRKIVAYDLLTKQKRTAGWKRWAKQTTTIERYKQSFNKDPKFRILDNGEE